MLGFQQSSLGYGTYYSGPAKQPASSTRKLLPIVGVVILLLAAALFVLPLLGDANKKDVTLLAVHENSLLTLVNGSRQTIRNPDLSAANSTASLLLLNDVTAFLGDTNQTILPSDLVKQAADTNSSKLKQAVLLNKFDTTYRQIIQGKAATLATEAQTVRTKVSNKKLQTDLDQAIVNLQSIDKTFSGLQLQ